MANSEGMRNKQSTIISNLQKENMQLRSQLFAEKQKNMGSILNKVEVN